MELAVTLGKGPQILVLASALLLSNYMNVEKNNSFFLRLLPICKYKDNYNYEIELL